MRRYFKVTEIVWGRYLNKCDWHEVRRETLPTDQNFLMLENVETDISDALKKELVNTYGYDVDSLNYIEMSEEEADKEAIFLLVGHVC